MNKKDTSVIPKGPYCHNENGDCPYWKLLTPEEMSEEYQTYADHFEVENGYGRGYCAFLEKNDYDIAKGKTLINEETDEEIPGLDLPFASSLLWDQCKECGINTEDDEDYEKRKVEITLDIESKKSDNKAE